MSEEARIPGTNIETEVPPNQGVTIRQGDYKDLKDGDVVFLLQRKPNEVKAMQVPFKVELVNGEIKLKPIEQEDLSDLETRKELAKAIVQSHKEEIMEQAVQVTEEALARKPKEKLEAMAQETKKGGKAKMGTRKGCVFLEIGKEETVL